MPLEPSLLFAALAWGLRAIRVARSSRLFNSILFVKGLVGSYYIAIKPKEICFFPEVHAR